MFTSYFDRGTEYVAQKGVKIKYERNDFSPIDKEKLFAIGPNHSNYFPCQIDSYGNVCDEKGIVVYPSMSGKYPLLSGEHGYFGFFRENYGEGANSELPSISARSLKTARGIAEMTQQELHEKSRVDIQKIQAIESGEMELRSLPFMYIIALAKALNLEPHELI